MIYDDVENGDEGGHSSLEYGWSSSEFESYEEQSDSESRSGVPRSFLRGDHRKQAGVPAMCWGTACSHGCVARTRRGCLIHIVFTWLFSKMLMCSLKKASDVSKREEALYLIQYSPGRMRKWNLHKWNPSTGPERAPCPEHSGNKEAFPGYLCCVHTALLVRSRLHGEPGRWTWRSPLSFTECHGPRRSEHKQEEVKIEGVTEDVTGQRPHPAGHSPPSAGQSWDQGPVWRSGFRADARASGCKWGPERCSLRGLVADGDWPPPLLVSAFGLLVKEGFVQPSTVMSKGALCSVWGWHAGLTWTEAAASASQCNQ